MSGAATETCVVALVSDVMVGSRLEAAAAATGCQLRVVSESDGVASVFGSPVTAAILDLTDPVFPFGEVYGVIRAKAPEACVVAFFPHVRDDLSAMASSAGCEMVIPRSRFLTDPAGVMRSALELARSRRTTEHAEGDAR